MMRLREEILVAQFTALTAVGAFVKIPVPVVPFTLQWFFVALAGAILGPRLGLLSQLLYLALGLAGVPVFAEGGGPSYIFKPTFGYLIGFVLASYLIGSITQGGKSRWRYIWANLVGLSVVYFLGVTYLYGMMNWVLGTPISWSKVLWLAVILAAPGDILLCLIAGEISFRIGSRVAPVWKGSRINSSRRDQR